MKLDVTKQADIDSSFKSALEIFGRIDVVVNNAGYGLSGIFEEFTESQMRIQMEVNFFGLINVTKKAMEVMREQKPSGKLGSWRSHLFLMTSYVLQLFKSSKKTRSS